MAVTNLFTDKITYTYSGNGQSVTIPAGTYTGTHDGGLALVVPAGTTNMSVPIVFPVAGIQVFVMAASQQIVVKVNSTTTPTPAAITLKATAGLLWGVDFPIANPLTTDVTVFYLTNAGAVDATFNFRVVYN